MTTPQTSRPGGAADFSLVLGGLLAARAAFGGEYVNNYTVSGSDSATGLNVLNSTFPQQGGYGGQIEPERI